MRVSVIFICAFLCISVHAETFSIAGKKITVAAPKTWVAKTGLFEMPMAFLGPMQKDQTRGALTFTGPDVKTKSAHFAPEFKTELETEYKKKKLEWLKKHDGKLTDFLPPEEKKIPAHKTEFYVLGVRYDVRGKSKIDKTYYIACDGQFFMAKLILTASNHFFLDEVDKNIEELTCK